MPKKELTDFQLELLQKKRNKERVKQEQDLRKRIFALGVESNKERQLRISVANANKVIAAEIARKRGIVSEDESDDEDLDSQFQQRRRNRLISRQRHPNRPSPLLDKRLG
jgi:hypothetical protein